MAGHNVRGVHELVCAKQVSVRTEARRLSEEIVTGFAVDAAGDLTRLMLGIGSEVGEDPEVVPTHCVHAEKTHDGSRASMNRDPIPASRLASKSVSQPISHGGTWFVWNVVVAA
jgi:hypothetical protein